MSNKSIGTMLKTGVVGMAANAKEKKPQILLGVGIGGDLAASVLACRSTAKAVKILEEKKKELNADKLTTKQVIKYTWKLFIVPVALGAVSTTSLILSQREMAKRVGALTTACALSESALQSYAEQVAETVGEKKEEEIRKKAAQDYVDRHPYGDEDYEETYAGCTTRCIDGSFGRPFWGDRQKIESAVNEMNKWLNQGDFVTVGDWYELLGLNRDSCRDDDLLGWDSEDGLVSAEYSYCGNAHGEPCLLVRLDRPPKYRYNYC